MFGLKDEDGMSLVWSQNLGTLKIAKKKIEIVLIAGKGSEVVQQAHRGYVVVVIPQTIQMASLHIHHKWGISNHMKPRKKRCPS